MFTNALSESQVLCACVIASFVATFLVGFVIAGILGALQNRAESSREAHP